MRILFFPCQVGEAIDAWKKFLELHEQVLGWSAEKNNFISEPLEFSTLALAKQKLAEYSGAMKSIKYATKNVQELDREFSRINQTASTGQLGEKLNEAEQKKAETETKLTEKVITEKRQFLILRFLMSVFKIRHRNPLRRRSRMIRCISEKPHMVPPVLSRSILCYLSFSLLQIGQSIFISIACTRD